MNGQAYINGKDIWSTWKASLVKGTYESLLKPAPMKSYIENSSRIEHGVRIEATEHTSRTDERQVSINIFIEGDTVREYISNLESFMDELGSGLILLKVPALGKIYKLVYTDCASYGDYGEKKGKFTVKFREPNTKDREVIE